MGVFLRIFQNFQNSCLKIGTLHIFAEGVLSIVITEFSGWNFYRKILIKKSSVFLTIS